MKRLNLQEQWTIEQQELAIPLLEPVFDALQNAIKAGEENYLFIIKELAKQIKEPELLGLLWLEDDEQAFNISSYEKRVQKFRKMTLKELSEYRTALPDFFAFIIPFITNATLAYFQGLQGVELKT